jgi:hypothetical protein
MENVVQFRKPTSTGDETDPRPGQRIVLRVPEQAERWLDSAPPTASQDAPPEDSPHTARLSFSVALITTFAPETYEIKQPLPISIYRSGEEYTASLFDANIHTTGDNEQEAFDNIKSLILDMFDSLIARNLEDLGPGPKRQLAVLKQFVSEARQR